MALPINKTLWKWSPDNAEKESFRMMYSNLGLSFCETLPLKRKCHKILDLCCFSHNKFSWHCTADTGCMGSLLLNFEGLRQLLKIKNSKNLNSSWEPVMEQEDVFFMNRTRNWKSCDTLSLIVNCSFSRYTSTYLKEL